MSPATPIQVTCPACQTPLMAQVHTIVDVSREPDLKTIFLQGKLNTATCAHCGQTGMLSMPFLYHDPDKQLLLVFVPDQISLKVEDREKIIGELVNALMNTIPAQERKAYLLQPKTFFSLQTLMEEVLMAEGITKEMIEGQRQALRLMQELLSAHQDEARLEELAEEHKEELDYEFFLLMSASIEAAMQEGDTAQAQELEQLRAKLLELASVSVPEPLPQDASKDDLIDKLLEAEDEEGLQMLLISNRPMVDYAFFQTLTSRIEALEGEGKNDEAAELVELRSQVLDITDELDRQARQAQRQVLDLVEELLESPDLDSEIAQHMAAYDTLFFMILGGMMEEAKAAKRDERLEKLQDLQKRIVAFLEESIPPEFRLISRLLSASYPDETAQILDEHKDQLQDLLEMMKAILASWEGDEERAEGADELQRIVQQASDLVQASAKEA